MLSTPPSVSPQPPVPPRVPTWLRGWRPWVAWALAGLICLLVYGGAWPLLWRGVLLPSAGPAGGVMIFAHHRANLAGAPDRISPGRLERLVLPSAHQSLCALALWRVPQAGRYQVRLQAQDYGHLLVDRRHLVALHGPQPANQGQASLELTAGAHFLELELDSYFGPGRLIVSVKGPGDASWRPLLDSQVSPLLAPRVLSWLSLVKILEQAALFGLAAWILAFFLLLALPAKREPLTRAGLAFALACLLAAGVSASFTTDRHERDMRLARGRDALSVEQMDFHRKVVGNIDPDKRDHRHFRLLPNYAMEGFMRLVRGSRVDPEPRKILLYGRWMVDFLIFILAAMFYRRLGLPRPAVILGLIVLAWVIYPMRYGCLLNHSTFLDAVFFLLAGLALVGGRPGLMIPITVLAVFNKETGLLIPLLPAMAVWRPRRPWSLPRKELLITLVCLGLGLAVYLGVRWSMGWEPWGNSQDQPGWAFVEYNLFECTDSWRHMFYTMGLMPFMALFTLRASPPWLRRWFWGVFPIWLVVHTVSAWWCETRVFLPPLALVVIPICLFAALGRGAWAADGQDRGEAGQGRKMRAEAGR